MAKANIEDYLEQGMYGKKEINPAERRKYLSSLRERVIMVLTQAQVLEKEVYTELLPLFKQHPKACVFLNGHMNYTHLIKYVKLATTHNIRYKIVLNKDHNSDLGLVFAEEFAIDLDNIYIEKKQKSVNIKPVKRSFWKRLIRFCRRIVK
ncbi:YueI family protein [Peribacillus asahii]|uniref:YueI family protein n=1 Tax=Peribacillus asahii TaxID=228899 RepID=UPI002079881D|nr:YueI family protein [Peribacillus asahii]USK68448.1 YueI family protein [Peribacillus asahii]